MGRVIIIGLDCLSPQLVFDAELPNMRALSARGIGGPLRSCDPPITVPAWAAMMTGHDPGTLGLYGFRDRADRGYHARRLASSMSYTQPPLWTRLSRHGLRCRVAGVPQTYPPKPLHGYMVAGCLSPVTDAPPTYPDDYGQRVLKVAPGYRTDVSDFRALTPADLLAQVHDMTDASFALARHWLGAGSCPNTDSKAWDQAFGKSDGEDWDFLMVTDMGCDRLHHGLWHYCQPEHPAFVRNSPYANALRDYYAKLDAHIGAVLEHVREDDLVMIVSDHGAQAMHGGIALNDWLRARGDLVLRGSLQGITGFDANDVDWSRTRAWADGGYVGRIYLNVAGREPEGTLRASDVDSYTEALRADLQRLPTFGQPPHAVHRSEELYREVRGIAPDLWVFLGDLRLRAIGSMGHSSLFVEHNDTGIDGANHARDGVLMAAGPVNWAPREAYSLYDIAPTILEHFAVPATGLRGTSLIA